MDSRLRGNDVVEGCHSRGLHPDAIRCSGSGRPKAGRGPIEQACRVLAHYKRNQTHTIPSHLSLCGPTPAIYSPLPLGEGSGVRALSSSTSQSSIQLVPRLRPRSNQIRNVINNARPWIPACAGMTRARDVAQEVFTVMQSVATGERISEPRKHRRHVTSAYGPTRTVTLRLSSAASTSIVIPKNCRRISMCVVECMVNGNVRNVPPRSPWSDPLCQALIPKGSNS